MASTLGAGQGDAFENPALPVKKLPVRNTRLRYLSKDEEKGLLAECAPHLRPIVLVAIYSGLREGEVLGLRWSDIDFDNDLIHVEDTKGDKRRDVPMARVVRQTLRALPRHIRSPYVFCKVMGARYGRVDKGVRAACGRAGIEGVVFHTFRHTFASRLTMAGVHPFTLQELLGHSSLVMVRRYSHLSPEHRKAAIQALDQVAFESDVDTLVDTSQEA